MGDNPNQEHLELSPKIRDYQIYCCIASAFTGMQLQLKHLSADAGRRNRKKLSWGTKRSFHHSCIAHFKIS